MNYVAILLAIVIVILIYVLYQYFTVSSTTLTASASLNTAVPVITNLQSPKSVSYAYSVWLFVNSWNPGTNKYIFTRANNIKLYLDPNTPTLKCDVYMASPPAGSSSNWKTVTITNNFPLQTWTLITISMDGNFMDAYLNGKLVLSSKLMDKDSKGNPVIVAVPPDTATTTSTGGAGAGVYLGNSDPAIGGSFDAYVAKFNRSTAALDPTTVWNTYLQGNGQSNATALSSYGVNLNILQNNVLQGTYTLV
jgi:hypothetical protein